MRSVRREIHVGWRVNRTLSLYADKHHSLEGCLSRRHTQPFAGRPWTLPQAPQEGRTRQGGDTEQSAIRVSSPLRISRSVEGEDQ